MDPQKIKELFMVILVRDSFLPFALEMSCKKQSSLLLLFHFMDTVDIRCCALQTRISNWEKEENNKKLELHFLSELFLLPLWAIPSPLCVQGNLGHQQPVIHAVSK